MYYYIVDKITKQIIEINDKKERFTSLEAFKKSGKSVYEHFPYLEFGFSNPYDFLENYELVNLLGEKIDV